MRLCLSLILLICGLPAFAQTPTPIVPRGKVTAFTDAEKIALYGDYAYVVDRTRGLAIVDIRDASHPQLVRYLRTPAGETGGQWIDALAIGEGYLVIADTGRERLHFYSLADPDDPELAAVPRTSSLAPAAGLAITGGRLWVSGGDRRLEIYTLGDFSSVAEYQLLQDWDISIGYNITPGPHGLYLSARKNDNTHAMVPFDTDNWPELRLRGDVAMPAPLNYRMPARWRGNVLYGLSSVYLSILEATGPSRLELSQRLNLQHTLLDLATQEEGYLLASSVGSGVYLVDVRDPFGNIAGIPDPGVVARLSPNPGGSTQIYGLAVRARLLFAAGTGTAGLQIYDLGPHLRPPASPTPTPTGTPTLTPTSTPTPRSGDLNLDGVVDQYDLLILMQQGAGAP